MGFNNFGPGGFGGPTGFDGGLNGMADDHWLHDQVARDAAQGDGETINLKNVEITITRVYSDEQKEFLYNSAVKRLKEYGYPIPLIDKSNDDAFAEFLEFERNNTSVDMDREIKKNRLAWEAKREEDRIRHEEERKQAEEQRRIYAEERRKNQERVAKIRAEKADKNREYAVDNEYQVCQVVLEASDSGKTISSRAYTYLYKGIDLSMGDQVYVPFGWSNDLKLAKVVGLGRYKEENLPVELGKMKAVVSKK